mgnify:CR=1 FL=1
MKTLNKLGYSKVEVLIVVVLLGVVAFITINKTSYAFGMDNTKIAAELKNLIEIRATDYGLEHKEIFEESGEYVVTVEDLIDNHYLEGNADGIIINPMDNNKSYNNLKVRLIYNKDNNEIDASIINQS